MEPGEVLLTARRRHGLTQTDVARRAGTSQPVISAYERGRRDPTLGTLRRLVAATGEHLELGLARRAPDLPPLMTPEEHGDALVDLLLLADALPQRPRPLRPAWPRLVSR